MPAHSHLELRQGRRAVECLANVRDAAEAEGVYGRVVCARDVERVHRADAVRLRRVADLVEIRAAGREVGHRHLHVKRRAKLLSSQIP